MTLAQWTLLWAACAGAGFGCGYVAARWLTRRQQRPRLTPIAEWHGWHVTYTSDLDVTSIIEQVGDPDRQYPPVPSEN